MKFHFTLNTTSEELFANEHLRDTEVLMKEIIINVKKLENDRIKLKRVYKMIKYFLNE